MKHGQKVVKINGGRGVQALPVCECGKVWPCIEAYTTPTDDGSALLMAVAFARLEIIELQAGRRTLTQCPGIEQVAQAIKQAKEGK